MPWVHPDVADVGSWLFVGIALAAVCIFEAVNGFHDTANAVATVIYTNTLRPLVAVIWSGICNFFGVYFGGLAVAFTIVHLLPVDLLVNVDADRGLAMVFSLLGAAITWNLGTWYLGLPASSSHALIGSIIGVGLANSLAAGQRFGAGVNWHKAAEVGLSLLISPLLGFGLAMALLLLSRRLIRQPQLYEAPVDGQPPPGWVRAILVLTCTGVSFAHGSNDGQKGVGIVMLILIGLLPAHYVLNLSDGREQIEATRNAAAGLVALLDKPGNKRQAEQREADQVSRLLADVQSYDELSVARRWELRDALLELDSAVRHRLQQRDPALSDDDLQRMRELRRQLTAPTEYAPTWVLLMVASSLGVGTTIGWKRIVVTVGEKIGKMHLSYGQGACAELVAMSTIGIADGLGFPVSTTHVLSSAVAGTMVANRAGVQMDSIKKIVWAWVLTLPATILLAGVAFYLYRLVFG
ncbi:MAG TPA: inorganic phosphate transporter [Pirellulales bacterium]|nr:inorganic phosphate transporter [Pirellulales bacterium]